ncbi:MAG: transposase, partial [Serratia symbiotica]|nr:transposase [Serratia symbiotica]
MVKRAAQPAASVTQIAREHGIKDTLIFKWLRLWQNAGRISRRLPATVATVSSPALLPVEVISAPIQSGEHNATTCQP